MKLIKLPSLDNLRPNTNVKFQMPSFIQELTACEMRHLLKSDSFKLNTTLWNLRLKQSTFDLGSAFDSDTTFHMRQNIMH